MQWTWDHSSCVSDIYPVFGYTSDFNWIYQQYCTRRDPGPLVVRRAPWGPQFCRAGHYWNRNDHCLRRHRGWWLAIRSERLAPPNCSLLQWDAVCEPPIIYHMATSRLYLFMCSQWVPTATAGLINTIRNSNIALMCSFCTHSQVPYLILVVSYGIKAEGIRSFIGLLQIRVVGR